MLLRTALSALVVQLLLVSLVAAAVPRGGGWLTLAGFVTPYYDRNVFAVHLLPIPATSPQVYLSVQTLVQMLAIALAVSGVVTLARTNPWQHGILPNSTPPAKDPAEKPAKRPAGDPAAPAPPAPPAAPPTARPAGAP